MCKLLNLVYFSLLLVIVESNNISVHDSPVVERHRKRYKHHHSKSKHAVNEVASKTNDITDTNVLVTTEHLIAATEENNTENPIMDFVHNMFEVFENETNEHYGKTGDLTKAFVGLNEDESSTSEEYSDSSDFDKDTYHANNDSVGNYTNNGTGEVMIHTPFRKSMSQDAVLDLKARSGHVPKSEEDDSKTNSNLVALAKSGLFSQRDIGLRPGYIPTDEVDSSNVENYVQHINRLLSHSNYQQPQFNYPRSDMYNALQNYRQRYSPLFFENSDSREINPVMNRDIWAKDNTGQQIKSYFGLTNPSNQYSQRERCPTCTQGMISSEEHSNRLKINKNLKTANGRSVEYDPSGANAYPFVEDAHEINHVLSPNEVSTSGMRQGYVSQEVGHNVPSNRQTDSSSLSKYLMTLPSQFQMSSPLLLRRPGFGGLQRYF